MKEGPNEAASFEFAALGEARNYRRALIEEFSPTLRGHVLEIGSGIGQMTEHLRQLPNVERILSVEPDPAFCREFQKRLPGQAIAQGTVEQVPPNTHWTAIFSVNVLEHIRDDEGELRKYRELLAQRSGALHLFVPARQEIYAPIDKDFGHYRRYSKGGLTQKLEQAGFKIERLRYYNVVGYFAWWASFCVLKKRNFDPGAVRLFDRVIFPCVHAMETHIMAPPFGQSLLAVARA